MRESREGVADVNLAIMLARFKMSHQGIRDALLRIDDTKVSIDNLLAIKHYIPTTDEVSRFFLHRIFRLLMSSRTD